MTTTQTPVKKRPLLRWLQAGPGLALLAALLPQIIIPLAAVGRLYSLESLPPRQVGLVLGTSKFLSSGQPNRYYRYRIDAAEAAYKAGKVRVLLLSGDNSTPYYDEPSTMRADLIARGIPAEKLVLDYAGFRTLDSVVRAAEVFGTQEFTVISQPFHNQRAIFLARARGINAIGLNARDVTGAGGVKVQQREFFARIAAVLDIVLGQQPRFLGAQEEMPE